MKITRAVKQIFKITSKIKNLATSIATKYSGPTEGYENVSHEFTFKKQLSEFVDFKETNSCGDFGIIHKEGVIDWSVVRKLIYARFADEIGAQPKNIADIKSQDTKEYMVSIAKSNISEEFKELRSQGYDFKRVANLIEQKKGVVVNEYELEGRSNISDSSLLDRMKKLSIAGYLSNYAGDDNLRQDIEEVMQKKEYVMQEFMLRVSSAKAYEVNLVQLESIDILGDH